jgi:erythromycin esterase-like protein
VSITSHYAEAALPRLIAAASSESTATECRQTVSRNVGWTYDAKNPFDEREQLRLQQCARNAVDAAAANRSLDAADRVMLESFARSADRQRLGVTAGRDDSMYRNLVWYLERLPANSRVVIWTATVHAARQRGSLAEVPLGGRVVERWGDRVGTVGFTAYAGTRQGPGGPRAQSLTRRQNRWKPRRRANQPRRCWIPRSCEQSAASRPGCLASSSPKRGRITLTPSS